MCHLLLSKEESCELTVEKFSARFLSLLFIYLFIYFLPLPQ